MMEQHKHLFFACEEPVILQADGEGSYHSWTPSTPKDKKLENRQPSSNWL